MPTYKCSAFDFYAGIGESLGDSPGSPLVRASDLFLCERAIGGLVERYALQNRSILSLGAGNATEEYWFYRAGCKLTLNDINMPAPTLATFKAAAEDSSGECITYHVEDAADLVERLPDGAFDVLYVSSLHPDEVRRENIQAAYKVQLTPGEVYHHITWPHGVGPYLDTITKAFAKVRVGGMVILQHYRGGVYVNANPHYLDAVRGQLAMHGIALIETYSFRRSPAHMLVVAYRGNMEDATDFAQGLAGRPEIGTFHGRYPDEIVKTDVVKTFALLDPSIRPETAFLNVAAAGPEVTEQVDQTTETSGSSQELAFRLFQAVIDPSRLVRAAQRRLRKRRL